MQNIKKNTRLAKKARETCYSVDEAMLVFAHIFDLRVSVEPLRIHIHIYIYIHTRLCGLLRCASSLGPCDYPLSCNPHQLELLGSLAASVLALSTFGSLRMHGRLMADFPKFV